MELLAFSVRDVEEVEEESSGASTLFLLLPPAVMHLHQGQKCIADKYWSICFKKSNIFDRKERWLRLWYIWLWQTPFRLVGNAVWTNSIAKFVFAEYGIIDLFIWPCFLPCRKAHLHSCISFYHNLNLKRVQKENTLLGELGWPSIRNVPFCGYFFQGGGQSTKTCPFLQIYSAKIWH